MLERLFKDGKPLGQEAAMLYLDMLGDQDHHAEVWVRGFGTPRNMVGNAALKNRRQTPLGLVALDLLSSPPPRGVL